MDTTGTTNATLHDGSRVWVEAGDIWPSLEAAKACGYGGQPLGTYEPTEWSDEETECAWCVVGGAPLQIDVVSS